MNEVYYFAFERLGGGGSSTDHPHPTVSPTGPHSNAQQHGPLAQAASTGSLCPRNTQDVRDVVTIVPTQKCEVDDKIIARLECPDSFYLYHLVALADVVHPKDPNYLLGTNCFWFTSKIMDTVEVALESVVVKVQPQVQQTRLRRIL